MRLVTGLKDTYSKKHLIYELAKSDFKKRFVGSYFGVFWMFMQPIVTIIIYFAVFQMGFKASPPLGIDAPYVLWLIPGIIPWFFINEAIGAATNALYDYNYLVKKVVFKISILPLIKIVSCLFLHVIFIYIMICVFLGYGYTPSINWIQLVYYSFCAFMLVLGISFATSAINVFFKDMGQIVNICLQFGMWLAPIMWPYTMAGDFVWIVKLNPVFYIVEGYRDAFLNNIWFFNKPSMSLYFWGFTLAVFTLGVLIFQKLKAHFSDVL